MVMVTVTGITQYELPALADPLQFPPVKKSKLIFTIHQVIRFKLKHLISYFLFGNKTQQNILPQKPREE